MIMVRVLSVKVTACEGVAIPWLVSPCAVFLSDSCTTQDLDSGLRVSVRVRGNVPPSS